MVSRLQISWSEFIEASSSKSAKLSFVTAGGSDASQLQAAVEAVRGYLG